MTEQLAVQNYAQEGLSKISVSSWDSISPKSISYILSGSQHSIGKTYPSSFSQALCSLHACCLDSAHGCTPGLLVHDSDPGWSHGWLYGDILCCLCSSFGNLPAEQSPALVGISPWHSVGMGPKSLIKCDVGKRDIHDDCVWWRQTWLGQARP